MTVYIVENELKQIEKIFINKKRAEEYATVLSEINDSEYVVYSEEVIMV